MPFLVLSSSPQLVYQKQVCTFLMVHTDHLLLLTRKIGWLSGDIGFSLFLTWINITVKKKTKISSFLIDIVEGFVVRFIMVF